MRTFIDRHIEQGRQKGEAALLPCLIEDKLDPRSEAIRKCIAVADADTPLHWPRRLLTAGSLDAVLH